MPEFVELLQTMNDDERRGCGAGRFVAGASGQVVGEVFEEAREVALFGGNNLVRNQADDAVKIFARRGTGRAAVASFLHCFY